MNKKLIKLLTCLIPSSSTRKKIRTSFEKSDFSLQVDSRNNKYPKLIKGLSISIEGENNTIEIDPNATFQNSSIGINASNSYVKIKAVKYLLDARIMIYNGDSQSLEIGKNTRLESGRFFLCATGSKCIIGDDCMFSGEIQVWMGDGHQILDKNSSTILNNKQNTLRIGNHCWISCGAVLLKNCAIPNNTIVGAQSVVSKAFSEEFTVIAGNPAKIIKRDIDWKQEDPYTGKMV